MSKSLPPLFRCIVCGLPIQPDSGISERKAVVWLKAKGTSISQIVEELHDYKHSICKEEQDSGAIQDALF